MSYLTRVAPYGAPAEAYIPIPETSHLTLEQRAEYTFVMTTDENENYLIPEEDARSVSPLIEHMGVGDVFYLLK